MEEFLEEFLSGNNDLDFEMYFQNLIWGIKWLEKPNPRPIKKYIFDNGEKIIESCNFIEYIYIQVKKI